MHAKGHCTHGFAFMEPMIAVAILAIVASSTLYAMMASNRFVSSQRFTSNANALCQERIDQALTEPFTSAGANPSPAPSPLPKPVYFGTGALPTTEPASPTHSETVSIYTVSASGANLQPGTRNTWVTGYTPDASDPGFTYARLRVRVEFWLNPKFDANGVIIDGRGLQNKRFGTAGATPHSCEMTTLRAIDPNN